VATLTIVAWVAVVGLYLVMQAYLTLYLRRSQIPSAPDPAAPPIVLLGARNEAAILPTTLPTLLAQNMPLRFIAGDDSSIDETAHLLRKYLLPCGHTVCTVPPAYHAGYPGKQAVLAYLEAYATPPFFGVVDADMVLPPTWAQTLIGALLSSPEIGGVSGPSLPKAVGMWSGFQRIEWAAMLYLIAAQQGRGEPPPTAIGNSLWIRYEAWKSIGGWKGLLPTLVEDYHFMQALLRRGWRFLWVWHPGAMAETRPESSLKGWWHQRLRWKIAIEQVSPLAKFYWIVQLIVPWMVLIGGWPLLGVWVLAEGLPLWRLRQILRTRQVLRYLPLLLLYRYVQGMFFVWLRWAPRRLVWRGRLYQT